MKIKSHAYATYQQHTRFGGMTLKYRLNYDAGTLPENRNTVLFWNSWSCSSCSKSADSCLYQRHAQVLGEQPDLSCGSNSRIDTEPCLISCQHGNKCEGGSDQQHLRAEPCSNMLATSQVSSDLSSVLRVFCVISYHIIGENTVSLLKEPDQCAWTSLQSGSTYFHFMLIWCCWCFLEAPWKHQQHQLDDKEHF